MSAEQLRTLEEYASQLQGAVRIPKNGSFSRADVVRAFQSSFDLIGGVPRLALWADANPSDFYKLYSKLLPSATVVDLNVKVARELKDMSIEQLEEIVAGGGAPPSVANEDGPSEAVIAPSDVEFTNG